jgi:hypothetical protein
MATQMDERELDLQEQLARIRQMGAEHDRIAAETRKLFAESRVVSVATIFQGFIAVAALLGAGAAIAKLFFP